MIWQAAFPIPISLYVLLAILRLLRLGGSYPLAIEASVRQRLIIIYIYRCLQHKLDEFRLR